MKKSELRLIIREEVENGQSRHPGAPTKQQLLDIFYDMLILRKS